MVIKTTLQRIIKTVARLALPESVYRRMAFTRVYQNQSWGTDDGPYFSGVGSRGSPVDAYVAALIEEMEDPKTIVDLGCGDFVVGKELLKRFPNARYVGCDIVPNLIEHHQKAYANERVSFHALDIVSDAIPAGDVHLVRQVFQHLSNRDIFKVLEKLKGLPCVIVTEGQPLQLSGPPNVDKVASLRTRFDTSTGAGSGVYLDMAPYNRRLKELCRVDIPGSEQIVTWRLL